MNIIKQLKEKYNLAPNSYLDKNVWRKSAKDSDFLESAAEHKRIQDKWDYKVGANWYGIEMTDRMPVVFYKVIDEFLDWMLINEPNFEIHQIKCKFGGIRVYIGNISEEIQDFCWNLSSLLFDENLIY